MLLLSLIIRVSCFCSIRLIISIRKIVKKRATKVELKASPKLSVIPDICPDNASPVLPKAFPIPLTVPMKPIEGIAQEKNLNKDVSIC